MTRSLCLWPALLATMWAQPPAAPRIEFRENFHGTELSDPYHWLEDFDDPKVNSWISAQDRYASAFLAKLPGQDKLRRRLLDLAVTERTGVPQRAGNRLFYQRTTAASAHPLECFRDGVTSAEKIWLNPSDLPPDSGITRQLMNVSPDGRLAAYAIRASGQDEVEIRFREVDTGRDLPDRLPKALYSSVSFLPNGSAVYYGVRSRESGARIRFHSLGANSPDRVVFGEGLDARVFLAANVTRDGRWLLIRASRGWSGTDLYLKALSKADSPVRTLTAGIDEQFRTSQCGPGRLLATTTWKAPRGRAMMIGFEDPDSANWREIIPQSGAVLQHAACIGGRVYAHYMENVQTVIRVFSPDGKSLGETPIPPGSTGGISGDWDHEEAFLSYQNLVTPFRVDLFHVTRGKTGAWFEPKLPLKADGFEVRQIWFPSKDGTKIPIYLVSKKAASPSKGPLLLTGYGGFNVAMEPSYNPQAVVWAEQGAVWARPNLRGGSEFGEQWHRGGMLEKKQNVFDDFIAAAEWLVAEGYTTPNRLAISGASNGGLLVGAALTQRPDLFRAVYCGYPDLDMVRYHRYTKNNNPPALLEYGDGSNPKHFPFLRSWSPYERVREGGKYPAVLFTTGEGDTRVPPQQAVKMAAKLQWATRSANPVLLRFYRKSGHAGGRGIAERAAETAAEYAFLMQQVGITFAGTAR